MPKKDNSSHIPSRPIYSIYPWICRHYPDHSELVAYAEISGNQEIVASINATSGATAERMAEFIAGLVNDNQKNKNILSDAMEALEQILHENGLTFTSEQAADAVVTRIKSKLL